jgi:hypothetical protein
MWKCKKSTIPVGSDQVEEANCYPPFKDYQQSRLDFATAERSSGLIDQRIAMFYSQSPSLEVIPNRLVAHRAETQVGYQLDQVMKIGKES